MSRNRCCQWLLMKLSGTKTSLVYRPRLLLSRSPAALLRRACSVLAAVLGSTHALSQSMHTHGYIRLGPQIARLVLMTVLALLAGRPYAIFCGIIQCEYRLCSQPCIHLSFAVLPCWQALLCMISMSSRSLHPHGWVMCRSQHVCDWCRLHPDCGRRAHVSTATCLPRHQSPEQHAVSHQR